MFGAYDLIRNFLQRLFKELAGVHTWIYVFSCTDRHVGGNKIISYDFSILKPQNAIAPHIFVKILNDYFANKRSFFEKMSCGH